jgi:Metallo-peptidase family M12
MFSDFTVLEPVHELRLSMFFRIALVLVAVTFSACCMAQQRKLFSASDFFGPERERQELNQSEKEMIRALRATKAVRSTAFLVVDADVLDDVVLSIEFPGKKVAPLRRPIVNSFGNDRIWIAEGATDPDHAAMLRVDYRDGLGINGMIRLDDGTEYSFRHVRGRLHLLEQFQRDSTPDHLKKPTPTSSKSKTEREVAESTTFGGTATTDASIALETALSIGSNTVIDVLFVITPGAASQLGSSVGSIISTRISQANQVFTNSGVSGSLSSVGWVAYNREPLTVRDAVATVTADANILKYRIERRADIVVLIGTFNDEKGGSSVGDFNWRLTGVAVGVTWFLDADSYTFIHEVGHLLGADHDPDYLLSRGEISTFPTGRGMIVPVCRDFGACHGTVMSIVTGSCNRLPYFSSTLLSYHGSTLGTWNQNNSGILQISRVAFYSDQMVREFIVTPSILDIIFQ